MKHHAERPFSNHGRDSRTAHRKPNSKAPKPDSRRTLCPKSNLSLSPGPLLILIETGNSLKLWCALLLFWPTVALPLPSLPKLQLRHAFAPIDALPLSREPASDELNNRT